MTTEILDNIRYMQYLKTQALAHALYLYSDIMEAPVTLDTMQNPQTFEKILRMADHLVLIANRVLQMGIEENSTYTFQVKYAHNSDPIEVSFILPQMSNEDFLNEYTYLVHHILPDLAQSQKTREKFIDILMEGNTRGEA